MKFNEFVSENLVFRNVGLFYLSIIDNPETNIWYKTIPMGVHTINNILKSMKNNSPLASVDRKITNHSARKSLVRKLRESGIPKCEIKNITGHSSEKGLDPYDSGDDGELHKISTVIEPEQHQVINKDDRKGKCLSKLSAGDKSMLSFRH